MQLFYDTYVDKFILTWAATSGFQSSPLFSNACDIAVNRWAIQNHEQFEFTQGLRIEQLKVAKEQWRIASI